MAGFGRRQICRLPGGVTSVDRGRRSGPARRTRPSRTRPRLPRSPCARPPSTSPTTAWTSCRPTRSAGCARSGSRRSTPSRTRRRSSAAPTATRETGRARRRGAAHRPPARPRRRRRPGRHRLARADRPRLLPGHARRPDGRAAAPPLRLPRRAAELVRGRAPRPRRGARAWTRTCCARRSSARASGRCATSSPPSSPTRTSSCAPTSTPRCASRARRAPARPRSGCTAPPTCSTPIPTGCAAPACWSSGRTTRSCTTSRRCCRRSARAASPRARSPACSRDGARGRRAGRAGRAQGRRADGRRCCAGPSLTHVAKPADDVVAVVGTKRYRIGAHHLRRYVDDARRALDTGLRWTLARERLRTQVAEDVRRQREDAGGAPTDAETAKVARSPAVTEWVDAVWPALSAPALLARLYDDADFLARCSRGPLTDDERAALHRPAPRSLQPSAGPPADTVLLDELARDARRHRHVRARRGRRGPGPLADAVPGRRPALPARLGDRARRPGAGDHAVGAGRLGADAAPPRPRGAACAR